jgi:DNA-nicking Smr family endonuclease
MKKKKSDDEAPVDFKNNSFKSLKGFSPLPPLVAKKVAPNRKKTEHHEDESELFLRAVTGARKIGSKAASNIGTVATRGKTTLSGDAVIRERELFLSAMQNIGSSLKDIRQPEQEILEPNRRSASSRMRQLRRGTIIISRNIDLHGFLRDEALRRLEQFISESYNRGLQAVLVITGKGLNSPEGPVLKGAVAAWLGDQGRRMVVEFGLAPRNLGGSGAFVVFFKKK